DAADFERTGATDDEETAFRPRRDDVFVGAQEGLVRAAAVIRRYRDHGGVRGIDRGGDLRGIAELDRLRARGVGHGLARPADGGHVVATAGRLCDNAGTDHAGGSDDGDVHGWFLWREAAHAQCTRPVVRTDIGVGFTSLFGSGVQQ